MAAGEGGGMGAGGEEALGEAKGKRRDASRRTRAKADAHVRALDPYTTAGPSFGC